MKRDLDSISQTTAAASQIAEFNKPRAKTPSEKNQARPERIRKYAFSTKTRRHIKKVQEHAILYLSVLACVQMPRLEKLLLLQGMAELLALHLVFW